MKSYTTGRNIFGVWTKNASTANLTFGDQIANDDYRAICSLKDWPFLERSRTLSTTASTQFMALPYDCDQVREISVVPNGSSTRYVPKLSPSQQHWDHLNLTTFTSDIPVWYFVLNGQIGLWPKPAQTGNVVTVIQKTRVIDLSIADITSTTVTTATNNSASLTVSGGVTALMTGMWIRITYVPGSTNTGDGVWYEISSVSGTTITLVRAYGGTSIAAGTAACTISQMPLLPEAFHDLPWMQAAGDYWAKESDKRATFFFNKHGESGSAGRAATGKIRELIGAYSSPTTDMVLDDGGDRDILNPNLTITM